MIGLLRRRDFGLLWCAGLVSVAGDSVLMAVLPYLVYTVTGSTVATAGMAVAELVPGILLTSWAGVLVDRWDRRRVLVVTNLLQAGAVSLLLFVRDPGQLALVYLVAVLQSSLSAFSLPAEAALLPSLVPERDLVPANALNVLNNRFGRLLGLPLGALAFAAGGLGVVVLLDVASFVGAAGLVALMRRRRAEATGPRGGAPSVRTFLAEWLAGLRIVRQDRSIAVLFVVFGLMTFAGTMLDPLQAPWVRDVLHEGTDVYALLKTVHAAAGIAGTLVLGACGARFPPTLLVGAGSVLAGAALLVRFNVPVVAVAVGLGVLTGMTSVAAAVGVETLAQQRVPEDLRGRVYGSLQAVIWLLSLLGAGAAGVGGEVLGVVPMLNLASALTVAAGVLVLLALPRRPRARAARPWRRTR